MRIIISKNHRPHHHHHHHLHLHHPHHPHPQVKSRQVSPNALWRAQCKGGGREGKYRYTRNCTTYRRLSENVVATCTWNRNRGSMEAEHPIGPHFSQLPKNLYLQNISNLVSQACFGRPREGCVGSGCHASALLTQRSAGKFAM